jgi:hypothetical protein
LYKYDQVIPGAANRIIVLMEQEASHRRKLEEKTIDHQIAMDILDTQGENRRADWGVWVAGGSIIFFLLAGAYAIKCGHAYLGTTISMSGISIVTGTFLLRHRYWSKDASQQPTNHSAQENEQTSSSMDDE